MLKLTSFLFFLLFFFQSFGQQKLDKLTVEKIMRDPNWIGTSPSNIQWRNDGKTIYYNWTPEKALSDSLYSITLSNKPPFKVSPADGQNLRSFGNFNYNLSRSAYVYAKDGDIFYTEVKTGKTKRITQTVDPESNPQFSFSETKIVYNRNQNLYALDIATGETMQLTNLRSGEAAPVNNFPGRGNNQAGRNPNANLNQQEDWLKNDQLTYFEVLRSRKDKRDKADAFNKTLPKIKELRNINIEDKMLQGLSLSPDGRFVSYRLVRAAANAKTTIVPSYVTETGFTTDIQGRTKVGATPASSEFYIYDRDRDTVWAVRADSTIPGIKDFPDYVKDYPKKFEERSKNPSNRPITFNSVVWSPRGANAVVEIRSSDNKDRWLMLWDTAMHKLK